MSHNFKDKGFDPFVFLLNPVNSFSRLSLEEKIEIKNICANFKHNPLLSQKDGKIVRKFQMSWLTKYTWLAGSPSLKKAFCFPCFLFDGNINEPWEKKGIEVIKNFDMKAAKHQSTLKHIKNFDSFHMLGRVRIDFALSSAARTYAIRQNEKVAHNRKILLRMIDSICFLGKQELAFRGHYEDDNSLNKGNYLELLDLLAMEESNMRDHLENATGFRGTSSEIQNELIELISKKLKNTIEHELSVTDFVSVQADETTDVSCMAQLSIIVRYVFNNEIKERFIGFFDVSDKKNAQGLSSVILSNLEALSIKEKLVSQTYDGASVMSGERGGVQALIKKVCPEALFIHCYAHQLNLVLLYGASHIKDIKLFVCNLTAFHTFFARSTARANLLRSKGFKLPHPAETRWNYHSRSVNTIKHFYNELKSVMEAIISSDNFDYNTINMAIGLKNILKSAKFAFLICFYAKIFIYIDHVYLVLQSKISCNIAICLAELENAKQNISLLRSDDSIADILTEAANLLAIEKIDIKNEPQFRRIGYELIDTILCQMDIRFNDLKKFDFVELLNHTVFSSYQKHFPKNKLEKLMLTYPKFFIMEKLKNELLIIYSDSAKKLPPLDLLKFLTTNGLEGIYTETVKLIHLILTIPSTTASSERSMSTLKRVKSFARNTMTNHRLSNLCFLSIEKELLKTLLTNPSFKEGLVDEFAGQKNRRIDLLYTNV